MTNRDFRELLLAAVAGNHTALEGIMKLYTPLIYKYSYINGKYDEDLHQYIMIRIALNPRLYYLFFYKNFQHMIRFRDFIPLLINEGINNAH